MASEVSIINMGLKDMDWMNLVQDSDKWQAFVNNVTNLWVP